MDTTASSSSSLCPRATELHGGVLLLLQLLEVLLAVHHHAHLDPVTLLTQVPHPPLVVQQPGLHVHGIVAQGRQVQQELGLEVVLLYGLSPLQGSELRGLLGRERQDTHILYTFSHLA